MLEYIGAAKTLLDSLVTVKEHLLPGLRGHRIFELSVKPTYEKLTPVVTDYMLTLETIAQSLFRVSTKRGYLAAVDQLRSLRLEQLPLRIEIRAQANALASSLENREVREYFSRVARLFEGSFMGHEAVPSATNMLIGLMEEEAPSVQNAKRMGHLARDQLKGVELQWQRTSEAYHLAKLA